MKTTEDISKEDLRLLATLLGRMEVDERGCWIWLGAKTGKGYGQLRWKGRLRLPRFR